MGERRLATYDDVLAAPRHVVAELVEGVLHTHPRPRLKHAAATSALGEELGPPFRRGRGGPGGWIILFEPELHLGGDILVPDLAAWRRQRLPELPDEPYAELAPDWACEVLSKSTEAFDRSSKLPLYAREGVSHVWLVDPDVKTLEVFRLEGSNYLLVATYTADAKVRAEPFDAIELQLDLLWTA